MEYLLRMEDIYVGWESNANKDVSDFIKHNNGSYLSGFLKCGKVKFSEHSRDTTCEVVIIKDVSDCTMLEHF